MKQIIISIILIIFLSSCAPAPAPKIVEVTKIVEVEITATPTSTPTITNTPTVTNTPSPTNTRRPTSTPKPTSTPRPTNTPTATQAPIILTGTGDSVVDFQKWDSVAILEVKYEGSSNFIVKSYSADNEKIDTLINEIGKYQGRLLMDVRDGEHSARFQIEASGPWEIQIKPLTADNLRVISVPATFEGIGDDVVIINANNNVDLMKIDASSAKSNFVVYAWTTTRRGLIVNEIAPYTGVVILDKDTLLCEINATGPWKIEVTTK